MAEWLGTNRHHVKQCPSTNDLCRQLADDGAPHGTLVTATIQTQGRGRGGNDWQSLPGNLFMSFLVRGPMPAELAARLSLSAGLGIHESLSQWGACHIKWPNDILMNGKKVCGILVESTGSGNLVSTAVIGVGINVATAPKERAYLRMVAPDVTLQEVQDVVVQRLDFRIEELLTVGLRPQVGAINERLWKGRGSVNGFSGVCDSLSPAGHLILRSADGQTKRVSSAEIQWEGYA